MNDVRRNTEIDTMVVLVTPELANRWLEKNTNNRKLKKHVVETYVNDMKNGKWSLTGDSITFDEEGVLTNGQHRLTAVVKSGTSQYFNVMKGIAHNINTDRGASRSVGDNLRIFTDLPEICTQDYVIAMANFILERLNMTSKSANAVYDFMKQYEKEIVSYFDEIGIGKKAGNKYRNASILSAWFLAYINGVDADLLLKARKTFLSGEYVYDGYSVDRFLPIVKFEKNVKDMHFKTHSERYSAFLRAMFALNCIDTGKYLKVKNREVDEITYDIEYKGNKLSEKHEIYLLNLQNKKGR